MPFLKTGWMECRVGKRSGRKVPMPSLHLGIPTSSKNSIRVASSRWQERRGNSIDLGFRWEPIWIPLSLDTSFLFTKRQPAFGRSLSRPRKQGAEGQNLTKYLWFRSSILQCSGSSAPKVAAIWHLVLFSKIWIYTHVHINIGAAVGAIFIPRTRVGTINKCQGQKETRLRRPSIPTSTIAFYIRNRNPS